MCVCEIDLDLRNTKLTQTQLLLFYNFDIDADYASFFGFEIDADCTRFSILEIDATISTGLETNTLSTNKSTKQKNKTFPILLKLISGTLREGANYENVYIESNDDCQQEKTNEKQTANIYKIPTLAETARKVARLENKKLDEKQYIAYEIIACTFLLGLVHDGSDPSTTLYKGLEGTMGRAKSMKGIVRRLKARGGQNQMVMFLTGPAGSGKSTAVTVAQQFCHDFCLSVGVIWGDTTFLFTAYTGAAASLFGGVTISSAAFLNKQKPLSLEDINEWQDVRILIIDEVSFMSDKHIVTLDNKLKLIGDRNKPFGGFSIVFAGDFRQLPPVGATEFELIYSSKSNQYWELCINVIIILDNAHRFKDDPLYGQMLKRFWDGDLTKSDRERINSRVIGQNGIILPSFSCEGK